MQSWINNRVFKKIIVLFWTIWWLIALWTDIVGALSHLKLLNYSWAQDQNYPFLVQSLMMYNPPIWLPPFLFAGIILWSLIITLCFCWASLSLYCSSNSWKTRANYAFIISLTYWFAFFIADQFVMNFELEQNHMVQGGFQLLTFLVLYLLPDHINQYPSIGEKNHDYH